MSQFKLEAKKIGRRIQDIRREKRISQAQLAANSGISCNTCSSWEQGKFSDMRISHLYPMCQYLGVTVEYLLTGKEFQAGIEHEKLKESMIMVLNIYKDFLSDMTSEELFEKIMNGYYSDGRENFISSLETAFKR